MKSQFQFLSTRNLPTRQFPQSTRHSLVKKSPSGLFFSAEYRIATDRYQAERFYPPNRVDTVGRRRAVSANLICSDRRPRRPLNINLFFTFIFNKTVSRHRSCRSGTSFVLSNKGSKMLFWEVLRLSIFRKMQSAFNSSLRSGQAVLLPNVKA